MRLELADTTRLPKHRHVADGGYQRGEETRARIITTAVDLFGERGFDGTSTRDIASRAEVRTPALQYYFDSKEGLYLACVKHVIAQFWSYMSNVVERAESALTQNASDDALIDAFCAVQMQWADLFCTDDTNGWRRLLLRQQSDLSPPFAFQAYYEGVMRRMFTVTAGIVGRLLGVPAESTESQIRAVALGGQLAVFHATRRTMLLRTLKLKSNEADRLALLKRVIGEQTAAVLRSIAATRVAKRPARLRR